MRTQIAAAALLLATTPGCASAIASALGASGSSAQAAADLDAAMANTALRGLTSGGETHGAPAPTADAASFGGEPSFLCTVPGDDAPQTLAASSVDRAVATCAAMNAMPVGQRCTCREAELGSALPGPVAER